jgi:hypothetical protein
MFFDVQTTYKMLTGQSISDNFAVKQMNVFGINRFSVQLYMDWDKYDDNFDLALIQKFNEIEKNLFLPSINAWSFEMGKQERLTTNYYHSRIKK